MVNRVKNEFDIIVEAGMDAVALLTRVMEQLRRLSQPNSDTMTLLERTNEKVREINERADRNSRLRMAI